MTRFSDRVGITTTPDTLVIEAITDDLRISLWNLFLQLYDTHSSEYWPGIARYVARYFRKFPADDLPRHWWDNRDWVKDYFFDLRWDNAFNFLEFIVENHWNAIRDECHTRHPITRDPLERMVNKILERERSGYRFVAGTLSPISNPIELEEIATAASGLGGASEHIRTAVALFSQRPEADYRNAVKESISAVESVAKIIAKNNSAGLTPALRIVSDKTGMHAALTSAFEKLYGYTSDDSGIRHAILDEPTVGPDEAKYMIVACSAFVNYLISKSDKAGLLKVS